MNSEMATVDDVLGLFQRLSNNGYGDMKIRCDDGLLLYKDEVSVLVNPSDGEVIPITDRIKELKNDIQKAYEKFCGVDK